MGRWRSVHHHAILIILSGRRLTVIMLPYISHFVEITDGNCRHVMKFLV